MRSFHSKFTCQCTACGRTTTKTYARTHEGKCKACVTGVLPTPRSGSSYDEIAREGGYEDTIRSEASGRSMGVSPEAYESYRNGGSHSGDY